MREFFTYGSVRGAARKGRSLPRLTFWIFNFRFWIDSQENKPMNAFPSKSLSENRKSAIQNPKWPGLSVIAFVLVVAGAAVEAQQPKKVPRIGYLKTANPSPPSAVRQGRRG